MIRDVTAGDRVYPTTGSADVEKPTTMSGNISLRTWQPAGHTVAAPVWRFAAIGSLLQLS